MELNLQVLTEKQLEKLKEMIHEFQVENKLKNDISFPLYSKKKGDGWFMFTQGLIDKEQVKELLNHFPPSERKHRQSSFLIDSPFRVAINNPTKPRHENEFCFVLSWKSGNDSVRLNISLDSVPGFVDETTRAIFESQHVHYTGFSANEISKMRIKSYRFKHIYKSYSWYGGDKTLAKGEDIDLFMKKLLENEK